MLCLIAASALNFFSSVFTELMIVKVCYVVAGAWRDAVNKSVSCPAGKLSYEQQHLASECFRAASGPGMCKTKVRHRNASFYGSQLVWSQTSVNLLKNSETSWFTNTCLRRPFLPKTQRCSINPRVFWFISDMRTFECDAHPDISLWFFPLSCERWEK